MPSGPASEVAPTRPHSAMPVPVPVLVLDTNATLDWLLFDDSGMRPAAAAVRQGALRWVTCPRLREELAHTLRKPALAARLAANRLECEQLLSIFDRASVAVHDPVTTDPALRCRDATDQVFVDLALAQGAKWLLTHDRALLALRRRAALRGLDIARPAAWAAAWQARNPPPGA